MVRNVTIICLDCEGKQSFIANIEQVGENIRIIRNGRPRGLVGCKYCNGNRFQVDDYLNRYKDSNLKI